MFGEVPLRPLLLLADDRDDLGVHEDGVGSAVDLRLLVAELGDRCLGVAFSRRIGLPSCGGVASSGNSGSRSSRQISLTRRPSNATSMVIRMACSSPNPPSLDRSAEQLQPAHDLRHGVVVDDLALEPGLLLAGQLTAPVEAGVLRPEP